MSRHQNTHPQTAASEQAKPKRGLRMGGAIALLATGIAVGTAYETSKEVPKSVDPLDRAVFLELLQEERDARDILAERYTDCDITDLTVTHAAKTPKPSRQKRDELRVTLKLKESEEARAVAEKYGGGIGVSTWADASIHKLTGPQGGLPLGHHVMDTSDGPHGSQTAQGKEPILKFYPQADYAVGSQILIRLHNSASIETPYGDEASKSMQNCAVIEKTADSWKAVPSEFETTNAWREGQIDAEQALVDLYSR